jgi:hypothetical protein
VSDMERKYARTFVVWVATLVALYLFQQTFTP